MLAIIAAALSVFAAISEFTIVPYLQVGDAVPHPVLVLGVVWAIAVGFESGIVWAFVGGLVLDVLGQRPFGASAFSAVLAVAAASTLAALLDRARVVAPIIGAFVASPLYSLLLLVSTSALTSTRVPETAFAPVAPSAAYDAVLAALAGPAAVTIVRRRRDIVRVDW